jgi:hypothetical protein
MTKKTSPDPHTLVRSLEGLPCWYVSCGGCTLPTFQLALGDKVRRAVALKNLAHPEEYRHYEGEANLLVWCTWRLDGPEGPLTSSDDTADAITRNLDRLRDAKVRSASLTPNTWDLRVSFRNRLKLTVFCDHVPGDPSFDGNWELWLRNLSLIVGPGNRWSVEERSDLPAAPPSGEKPLSVAE